jgi:hypothetical protein
MAHKLVKFLQDRLLWNELSPDDRKAIAGFIPSKDQEVILALKEMDPKTALKNLFPYIDGGPGKKEGQPPEVVEQHTVTQQAATARLTDHVIGKEVVTRSSEKPMTIKPPLGVTPKELSDHRSDTHRRVAHWVSNIIAYATGSIDGVVDGAANGVAELEEDVAFFLSKMVSGAVHGWKRGKFPVSQDQ